MGTVRSSKKRSYESNFLLMKVIMISQKLWVSKYLKSRYQISLCVSLLQKAPYANVGLNVHCISLPGHLLPRQLLDLE